MNPNPDEQLLARWLDGELDARECASFEARLQSDAELRAEADSLKSLRDTLQSSFPKIVEIPHADFFNSQIQDRIAELRNEEAKEAPAKAVPSLFGWLTKPWLLAGATAVCALLALMQWQTGSDASTVVLSTYVPNAEVKAATYHSNEANATILMLDGLESIPADKKVVGYRVHHSETDQQVAMTTMYSDAGEVLAVLAMDQRNQPRLIAH
jgi:anti-sigma factor RsiW